MIRLRRIAAALALAALPLAAALVGPPLHSQPGNALVATTTLRVTSPTTAAVPGCGQISGISQASPGLALAGQTSWVNPGGQFVLNLSPTGTSATASSGLAVYIEVFDQLHSRSDFDQTLCNQVPTALIKTFGPVPLSSLASDPGVPGGVTIPITVSVPGMGTATSAATTSVAPAGTALVRAQGGGHKPSSGTNGSGRSTSTDILALSDCPTGCAGVYPVQVLLEPENGTHVLSEFTTQLVLAPAVTEGRPLALAWELPATAPPAMTSGGVPTLSAAAAASVATLTSALTENSQVALTLDPSPMTLAALSASGTHADHHTLKDLAAWASQPSHQVLAAPYGQVSASSLAGSGLSTELAPQLQAGSSVLSSTLHFKPRTSTWLGQGPVTRAGLTQLAGLPSQPVSRIVLADSDLAALPEQATPQITPIQPFALAGPSGANLEAVTADPGLASHLVDGPGAVLAAHQLLADLAMIYFDAPNATYGRGVVLETPTSWRPDPEFLAAALGGLANSPIVEPVTLDQLFTQTPESVIEPYGGVLVRQLASPSPRPPLVATVAIRARRADLDAFASTLGSQHPAILTNVNDLLLAAESTDLSSTDQGLYLDALGKLIDNQFGTIKLQNDTVTLTARTAQLPVSITSDLAYPVSGILELTSDKLGFLSPGPSREVTLSQPDKTVEFEVRVRATGKFPVEVRLVSPKDGLVLASGRFAVRSSAFSPVAIGLTVAAGLVLAGWWGRTLLRGRRNRNRHLIPAGQPHQ